MTYICSRKLKNARFAFHPNFSGAPTKFDPRGGKREFQIRLEGDELEDIRALGLNVKQYPRDPEPDRDVTYSIKVGIAFFEPGDNRNPVVWLVDKSTGRRTILDEGLYSQLDDLERQNRLEIGLLEIKIFSYEPTPMAPNGGKYARLQRMIAFYEPDDFDIMLAQYDQEGLGQEPELPFDDEL